MAESRIRTMLSHMSSRADPIKHEGEILVIGLGRFGSAVANTLVEMGHEVLGVDTDLERVQEHADALTHVVQADATSEKTLRQLGAADLVTALVCIGNDVEASVLTAAALVDVGVRSIWAKAITEAHGRILRRVGAHHVVFPEAEMGNRVAHLVTGSMLEYIALDENFVLVEMRAPDALVGRELGEAGLRAKYRVTVVCVKPQGEAFTYATRETVIHTDDLIVVAGHRDDVTRFSGMVD